MNNTLKTALLGSASFALMFAAAGRESQAQTAFDGFYAGIAAGYHSFGAKESSEHAVDDLFISGGPVNFFEGFSATNGRRSLSGMTGAVFGGFGKTFSRFYVGGEIEAGYSGASNSGNQSVTLVEGCSGGNAVNGAVLSTSVRAKESYGGSLRLGYLVADGALLYTRFGFQRTRFQVKSSVLAEGYNGFDSVSLGLISQSKSFNGFRFGMGAEVTLASLFGPTVNMGNSFVRVDWSHTWYQSKTFSGGGSAQTLDGSRQLSGDHRVTIKPTENKFMLGIGIRF